MKKFNNYLNTINEIKEEGFQVLKKAFENNNDIGIAFDIMSLPCMKQRKKDIIILLLCLIKDGKANDKIVFDLCEKLNSVSKEQWKDIEGEIKIVFEEKFMLLKKEYQLEILHTLECLYAKGILDCKTLIQQGYDEVPQSQISFSPFSYENVRIKLAKYAYSCNCFDYEQRKDVIDRIGYEIGQSKNKHLRGVFNYYKAISIKNAFSYSTNEDSNYYMIKSMNRGFQLAKIYLNHIGNHAETSKRA